MCGFVAGHGMVVAGTCPGVGGNPAALTSQPCLAVSCAMGRGGRCSARLANLALLMVFLHPCSSVLEKGAVSSCCKRKAALLAGEKAATPCFQLILSL